MRPHARDWAELEKDERIGIGQAAKPTNALGKGVPPKVYYYKLRLLSWLLPFFEVPGFGQASAVHRSSVLPVVSERGLSDFREA